MPKAKSGSGGRELNRLTERVTLARAFQLAHSLYRFRTRDREIALRIVTDALNGVEVRLIAQQEADRHDPQKPTKVRWNTQQWLQLLILCKSEAFERQQENDSATSLSHEDMIIRYVKHLIMTTSRRNSFHTCLGLTRLVYDYSAGDTMAIYDLVFQDPDASTRKSDAYYRGRKNKLIEELTKRFDQFLRIEQGVRGEKRFQSDSESNRFGDLILEYLTRFAPWDTSCKLPAHLDGWTTIHSLQFSEPSQIHSLIHPSCFARIIKALKLDDPDSRLLLPKVFMGRDESNETPPPDDIAPSELTPEEASEIKDRISEERLRRKKFVAKSLSVMADGIERARIDLEKLDRVGFHIEEGVNLIEIVGHSDERELLLASHILTHEESGSAENPTRKYSIILEGGQTIFLLLSAKDVIGGATDFSIEISYQQTREFSTVRLWWHQLKQRLAKQSGQNDRIDVPVLNYRFVLAALALIAVLFTLYFALRSDPDDRIAKYQPPPASVEPGKLPTSVTTSPSPSQAGPTIERRPSRSPDQSPIVTGPTPGDTTREQTTRAGRSLSNIQRIYVESLGDDVFSQSVRRELAEKLAGNRFAITRVPDEADTALSGSARRSGSHRDKRTGELVEVGNGTFQLLNVAGDTIWSRTYRGTAEQVAFYFVRDLLAAIETEKRGTKKE